MSSVYYCIVILYSILSCFIWIDFILFIILSLLFLIGFIFESKLNFCWESKFILTTFNSILRSFSDEGVCSCKPTCYHIREVPYSAHVNYFLKENSVHSGRSCWKLQKKLLTGPWVEFILISRGFSGVKCVVILKFNKVRLR